MSCSYFEFKRGEDVLEEVEKFCYLGDMISYYCGASEAVFKKGVKWCVSLEAGLVFKASGEDLSVLCKTSFVALL